MTLPSIPEAARALREGRLSAVELLESHLEGLRADPVQAVWAVTEGRAREAAEAADRDLAAGIDRGPLMGIPFLVKDLIDVRGTATTCGSRLPAEPAAEDAPVVAALVRVGAVPLAKVATYEFALTGPAFDLPDPPALNPWNPDHITGGSSSGSAAGVAAGLARLALGTDTGGSIRSPAAYCGVVGLKPSSGRLPCDGVHPLSPALDNTGPLAATVEEAALAYYAMLGEPAPETPTGLRGLRIGYAREWFVHDDGLDPEVLALLDAAASDLSLLGARVEEVELPDYALLEAVGAVIMHGEGLEHHRDRMRTQAELYGSGSYERLAAGAVLDEADLAAARALIPRLTGEMDAALAPYDAVVTAVTLAPAPPVADFIGGAAWTAMRTLPFNVTGHPALVVPAGFVCGLPIGLQIVGRRDDEAGILRVGRAFEAGTAHSAQRPPLWHVSGPGGDPA